jgi:hypothetical protein
VKRTILLVTALAALSGAPAQAATKTYSTGNIRVAVPAAGTAQRSLTVRDRGPVSFVRVSFRISTPHSADLAVTLVSPKGTEVPLVVHRGSGADFGEGKGCGGTQTVLDSDQDTNPVAKSDSPFIDNPYQAEGKLSSVYGGDARGRWTLKLDSAGGAATLECFGLDISRAVPETRTAGAGTVRATLTSVERNFFYDKQQLRIVRGGKTLVDSPLQRLHCRDCGTFKPVALRVRDLDGGEPEVTLEMFTGGAHCCDVVLVLRYDAAAKTYRPKLLYFGNYGYRLEDLDRDGVPEFSAYDERFLYTFTDYASSAAPVQITQYRQGRLIDVTRNFPKVIEKDAASTWKTYLADRKQKDVDLRAIVAVYVADQYLLDRPDEAKRALDFALSHGDLSPGKQYYGSAQGRDFVKTLLKDLRAWGYIR